MIFYGILGTFQNMTIQYATVTLTTLEKRFQIPSYVTGKRTYFVLIKLVVSV